MCFGRSTVPEHKRNSSRCDAPTPIPANRQRWSLDSLDWQAISSNRARESETLFYLVTAASFIESTTDRYTANLIAQFRGDNEITSWLNSSCSRTKSNIATRYAAMCRSYGQNFTGNESTYPFWTGFPPNSAPA